MRWRICYVPRSDRCTVGHCRVLPSAKPQRSRPWLTFWSSPLLAGLRLLSISRLVVRNPPIFIAHGLCGTVQFTELAKHIRTGHPIYGIQGKGLDEIEEPLERVEDMARFYLEALEELYPQGPYILIGYSFGGLVALEMAHRLPETGKNVALLVLIDAYLHPRYMAYSQRLRLFATRVRGNANKMRQLPLPSASA